MRYLKFLWGVQFYIHLVSGLIIFILTFVLAIWIIDVGTLDIDIHSHSSLGAICLIVVGIVVIQGVGVKCNEQFLKWKTWFILLTKFFHKVTHIFFHNFLQILGWCILIIAQAAIYTGVESYNENRAIDSKLGIIHVCIFFGTLPLLELIYRLA